MGMHVNPPAFPQAEKGVLDLRHWDFDRQGVVRIDGTWEFYWKRFLNTPEKSPAAPRQLIYGNVPSSWNQYTLDGQNLPGQGYGTYQLRILLPDSIQEVALFLLNFGTAYELYANNHLITTNGRVGASRERMQPYVLPKVCNLPVKSDTLDISIQVSNFHHKLGGFLNSIQLGPKTQIEVRRDRLVTVDILLAGSLLIMAVYHFGIFLLRRQDLSALYFSLTSLILGFRTLITDERYFLHLFPETPWELTYRLEYLTLYVGFPIFFRFFYSVYPQEFSKKLLKVVDAVFGVLTALVLFTPVLVFSQTTPYVQYIMVALGLYVLYALTKAIWHRRNAAYIFLFGYLIFFLTVSNDILYSIHVIQTGYWVPYGLLLFSFAQSLALSIKYARSFSIVEELSSTLEQRVTQRTAEIFHKNLELERQKSEIVMQNEIIEKKNQDITSSINYASRIQRAILGNADAITSNFKDSFIFLRPKDIVSGDFYWYSEVKRSSFSKEDGERNSVYLKIIVAADCTGHGIPGAFMTVMGSALLDEIINENKVTNPSRILSVLDRKLVMKLHKEGVNDGMDLAILIIDDQNMRLSFSGANNPLIIARDGEIQQIKGSKFPIGSNQYKVRKKFESHQIDIKEGDAFYIFSDGYQDQFGGEKGRKYYKKDFREFLQRISPLDMKTQKERLVEELDNWQGDYRQTDDILVIGIRV